MLLTYYDEKLHEKTLRKEVAESYEDKINLLNSTIAAKDSEIFVKDAALLESNAKISEMNAENGV